MAVIIRLITLALLAGGCAHSVHLVHVSDYNRNGGRGRVVTASAEQFAILGFVDNIDYVDTARRRLLKKCPGAIDGITTEFSTGLGFFSWTNRIIMRGRCS